MLRAGIARPRGRLYDRSMPAERTATSRRWVAISGLAACLAFVLSFVIAAGAPEAIRSDEAILDWYSDSSNQYRFVLGAFSAGLGVMAFLVFVVGFKKLLQDAGSEDVLAEIAYAAGLLLA